MDMLDCSSCGETKTIAEFALLRGRKVSRKCRECWPNTNSKHSERRLSIPKTLYYSISREASISHVSSASYVERAVLSFQESQKTA